MHYLIYWRNSFVILVRHHFSQSHLPGNFTPLQNIKHRKLSFEDLICFWIRLKNIMNVGVIWRVAYFIGLFLFCLQDRIFYVKHLATQTWVSKGILTAAKSVIIFRNWCSALCTLSKHGKRILWHLSTQKHNSEKKSFNLLRVQIWVMLVYT